VPRDSLRRLVARLPVDPDAAGRPDERTLSISRAAVLAALGGGTGALMRAAIEAADASSGGWPWATLIVNTTGTALLAVVLVGLTERFPRARAARPLIATGLLGGYTTFSTFALETVALIRSHQTVLAMGYVMSSAAGALGAAFLGLVLGRVVSRLIAQHHRARRRSRAGLADVPGEA
jgi:fluoride exporter